MCRVLEPGDQLACALLIDLRGFTLRSYRDYLFELLLSALASIAVFFATQGPPVACTPNRDALRVGFLSTRVGN